MLSQAVVKILTDPARLLQSMPGLYIDESTVPGRGGRVIEDYRRLDGALAPQNHSVINNSNSPNAAE